MSLSAFLDYVEAVPPQDYLNGITPFILAMTPRSGSSYLCDLLVRTKQVGNPGEYLNRFLLPGVLQTYPAQDMYSYIACLAKHQADKGVFGIKATYLHIKELIEANIMQHVFPKAKIVLLFRRNVVLQAVSLYRARESGIFHTNESPNHESLHRLNALSYNPDRIMENILHITHQEEGWMTFIQTTDAPHRICIYEDFVGQEARTVHQICAFLDRDCPNVPRPSQSCFRKIGNSINTRWADRFITEYHEWLYEIVLQKRTYLPAAAK